MPTASVWSHDHWQSTLNHLKSEYPGYSANELYAIWCHLHGKIPLDHNGKLSLEQWQIHAAADGEHVQEGGFKVSPAFYGRARKAVPGQAKPAQAPRSPQAGHPKDHLAHSSRAAFSSQATAFGHAYDRAQALVPLLLERRKEMQAIIDQLRDLSPGVLVELASRHPDMRGLLREAGLLPEFGEAPSDIKQGLTGSE